MAPSDYDGYFATSATAASALIGLLFVAVALRPETVFGDKAPDAGKALAASAFTALVNAFFISILALIPDGGDGTGVVTLAVISLIATGRLWRELHHEHVRWSITLLSLATFTVQLGVGIALIVRPHSTSLINVLTYLTIGAFSVALGRAWALLQGEHLRPDS